MNPPINPQDLLPEVILGIATPEEVQLVQAALQQSAALRAEYAALERSLAGLGATELVEPPPALKVRILEAARAMPVAKTRPSPQATHRAPRRRGLMPLLGALGTALAAVAVLFFGVWQAPSTGINATTVASLPDGGVVYGNSGAMSRTAPVVLVRSGGEKIPVRFSAAKECNFTATVVSDGLVYLLDSANDTVFIVEAATGVLVDRWLVPANASSLDVVGNTVMVRAKDIAVVFRRNQSGQKSMVEARLSSQGTLHREAAVIDGDTLYTTDQDKGVVQVLSSLTGQKLGELTAPEKPVSLAVRGGLWVLDASGALYKLALPSGAVQVQVPLEGTPQLLRLTDQYAFVADKEGYVSVVDLAKQVVSARKRLQNPAMSLSVMPDGHIALALEKRGIVVVDSKLEVLRTIY
jgi:hypothetical protein